jgi:hypothetical protein
MMRSCETLAFLFAIGMSASLGAAQTSNPEIESNDSKSAATPAASGGAGMASSDFISGISISAATTGLDYYRVKTASAPLAIYRHRLVITTSGTAGHTGTIRGLNQVAGLIGVTDTTVQTSSSTTTPARFNQWYGFGKGEEIAYRVTGTASTTSNYRATLESTIVTPVSGPSLPAGDVVITTMNQGHTSDTDMWLYDADLNAIVGAGNDDESIAGGGGGVTLQSRLVRNLTGGTYYLAISNFNTCNNLPSPIDDDFRTGAVLDYPDAIANTSTSTNLNVAVSIGGTQVPAAKAAAFDVVWIRFNVVDGCPAGGSECTADADGDHDVDSDDIVAFFILFEGGNICCDQDGDQDADSDDVIAFFALFEAGGC